MHFCRTRLVLCEFGHQEGCTGTLVESLLGDRGTLDASLREHLPCYRDPSWLYHVKLKRLSGNTAKDTFSMQGQLAQYLYSVDDADDLEKPTALFIQTADESCLERYRCNPWEFSNDLKYTN